MINLPFSSYEKRKVSWPQGTRQLGRQLAVGDIACAAVFPLQHVCISPQSVNLCSSRVKVRRL